MQRRLWTFCALILLLLGGLAAKSLLAEPPPIEKRAGGFDAERAKARLARVLGDQQPHPADSAANDAVRERLIAELRQIGLDPIVRDQFACNDFQKARLVACTRTHNVIARLGPGNGKALLMSAHYDSVPVGPGAGDAGIAVAALLEVAALLKDRPLERPVILLFNEGEELGLVGARAFLADPLSRDVDSLLNFEARGVTGPATMFETSQPNGAALAAFAKTVRRPFASSMATDIARLIPNDTDVSTFKERGWLTLNIAITGNETRYHSPGDDLAALDPRSLQHMGDQALALATELSAGLPEARSQQAFMDIGGRYLVQLPLLAALVLAGLMLITFAFIAARRKAFGVPLAAVVLALIAGGAAGWLSTLAAGLVLDGTYWRAQPGLSYLAVYATALAAIVAVLATLGLRREQRQLRAAFWLVYLVVGAGLAIAAPGSIVMFVIPPALALIGLLAERWIGGAEAGGSILAILFVWLSWGETLALLEELFSPGPLWVAAPVASLMILAGLVEALPLLRQGNRRPVIGFASLLALVGWGAAAAAPDYSPDRQQRFTIEHVTNYPVRQAYWSVLNDGKELPDRFTALGDWIRGRLPLSERVRWFTDAAPLAGSRPPLLETLEVVKTGDERRLKLRIRANGWQRISLSAPADAHIRAAGVGRFVRPIGGANSNGKFTIVCSGRSCDNVELHIRQGSAKPILFTVTGASNGLPAAAAPLLRARPGNARPQYVPDQTVAATRIKV